MMIAETLARDTLARVLFVFQRREGRFKDAVVLDIRFKVALPPRSLRSAPFFPVTP